MSCFKVMEIVLPLAILIAGLAGAYKWIENGSEKKKRMIWGSILMLVLAPSFAWLVGGLYATFGTVENSGWAVVIYPMLLFPLLFLIGLYHLLMGIFR